MSPSSSCSSRASTDGSQAELLGEKYEYDSRLHHHGYESEGRQSRTAALLKCRPSTAIAALSPGASLRYVYRFLSQILNLLIPSFLHRRQPQAQENVLDRHQQLAPTAFLDGMRGLAAFVVFICHLTYGTFDVTHAWGANTEPETQSPGMYREFLRLPVVRLLYSGPPMVAIFFVISGYALSYKPLKQMRCRPQQREQLLTTMSSSIFRRGLRLFLPCFASTLLVVVLAQLGLYKATEAFATQMRAVREDHCYTQPDVWSQLTDWMQQMLIFVDVFNWSLFAGSIELDRHLWTIPAEFRCSMALFLTHIMVARMSSPLRIATFAGLIIWGVSWDRWELCPFWAGAIIAEVDLIRLSSHIFALPSTNTDTTRSSCAARPKRRYKILYAATFLLSLFLLSYPDAAGHATPGYATITRFIPASFTEKHRFWPTIGAVAIVWATCNLCFLRDRVFASTPLQYLGKISFPLYVVHGPIIHTLGYSILPRTPVPETLETMRQFELAFLRSSLVITLAVIWAADVFLRAVDGPCVEFTRILEKAALRDRDRESNPIWGRSRQSPAP